MNDGMQPEALEQLFAENVKRRREEIGMTRAQLAEKIESLGKRIARHDKKKKPGKIFVQYIYDVEGGKKTPFLGNVALFAEALGTTPDALLSQPESKEKPSRGKKVSASA